VRKENEPVPTFHLVLLLHGHQPVGNFEHVFERAFRTAYLPFLQVLRLHPRVRVGLHLSGPVWEWLEQRHPEFFDLVGELVERGQVELVGGGFYEPILVTIPPEDRQRQLDLMADYLEERFGASPEGVWLAERVWEPHLVETLQRAGVVYTLVDDAHFRASGFEPEQLYGYYRVEDITAAVDVFPGLQDLRYLIPYAEPEQVVDYLRQAAERAPGGMAAMGDDLEKFGLWPGTQRRCYEERWLARFFELLEANADWLQVTTPGRYRRQVPARGRAVLPAASYPEMMTWALPTPARIRLEELEREFAERPEVRAFLRGGIWRSFLVKYPEAHLLLRRVLWLGEQVAAAERGALSADRAAVAQARRHLLRAQCNDAYWHGVFGGLYAPHLRLAVQRELLEAELALGLGTSRPLCVPYDFDADGRPELALLDERYSALLLPSDGGTLARLDFRPARAVLINALARRPEAYHRHVAQAPVGAAAEGTIHGPHRAREPGLANLLRYDRWLRHGFRLLAFPDAQGAEAYFALELDAVTGLAEGPFAVERAEPDEVLLLAEDVAAQFPGAEPVRLRCHKTFRFRNHEDGFAVRCVVTLAHDRPAVTLRFRAGLELVFNLLAAASEDRYFVLNGQRRLLGWQGVHTGGQMQLVDESQRVALTVLAVECKQMWLAPIETVSDSEEGFERVYQGSQILPVWSVELAHGESWQAMLDLRVTRL
jgi:hypothetical protein